MEDVEKEILNELSPEKAFKHMEFLVNEIGERPAGTKKLKRAAEYIRQELELYKLDAKIDNFYVYHSYPRSAELRVLHPETRVIEAKPCCHIASTLPEGIEGELIYVGAGGYQDYVGKDVRNKIVLVDMTWAPPRPEKARIAYEKRVKAMIIMNWGTTDNPVIQLGAVKSVWGNPTPETFKKIPQITVISITRAAGEYLKSLCLKGDVRVWLRAEATREWVEANQPIGILRGKERPEEFILVGGHLEAWGKTAICNSSGNSLTLELARVFAKYRDKLKRSIVFTFWDGHEVAEAAGSTWFVDTNWDKIRGQCIAYVNIDNPGILGTSVPIMHGVTVIKDFLEGIVEEVWGKGEWHDAYKGGDASFFGIGVPYISFYTGYTPEKLRELNWASLSPWIHSEADTIDKIDRDLFSKHLLFYALLVLRLCNTLVVPYNFTLVADKLIKDLKELDKNLERRLSLTDLIKKAEKLKEVAEKLNEYRLKIEKRYEESEDKKKIEEVANLINKALMKMSYELSYVLWSEAGRYGQDPYGYTIAQKPIPRLYVPIKKITELSEQSDDFKLWETKLIRERNRVCDAIHNSIDYAELVLALVEKKLSS
ncbi:MAG: M28 family metallopeptidase [Conexivisphaerales archaeon]